MGVDRSSTEKGDGRRRRISRHAAATFSSIAGRVRTMNPNIDGSEFGSITIAGRRIDNDVMIRLDGAVAKRQKKLSKAIYGTSHVISLAEAEVIFDKDAERLIIGAGHNGMVGLSDEAADYFAKKKVKVELARTPEAIARWNKAKGKVIGLFHVTC
jgi:hypothetical protein